MLFCTLHTYTETFVHGQGQFLFLSGVFYEVAAPACKFNISIFIFYFCTFWYSCCRCNMFVHLHDWDNRFALICLVLHALQHICYNLMCLVFQGFPVKSGLTDWLLIFWPAMCLIEAWKVTQEYLHFHCSDCRNTLIYAHSPHVWNEPRFGNCHYAWCWRLREITLTIYYSHLMFSPF